MTAKNAVFRVKDRLSNFDIDLEHDIVASIIDSASTIKKFGRETSPVLHLQYICVFVTFFYKSKKNRNAFVNETSDDGNVKNNEELDEEAVDRDHLILEFNKIVANYTRL